MNVERLWKKSVGGAPSATVVNPSFRENSALEEIGVHSLIRCVRLLLTTLTKELFIPRFLERDEGEREKPSEKYPWDGVSGVKPFRGIAAQTVVGVY